MSSENVGDAWVEIHASDDGLRREIETKTQAAADAAEADVALTPTVSEKQAAAAAKKAAKQASGETVTMEPEVDASATRRAAKVAADAAYGQQIQFGTDLDVAELAAKARAAAAAAKARIEVEMVLDKKGFQRDSRGIFRDLEGNAASAADLLGQLTPELTKAGKGMAGFGSAASGANGPLESLMGILPASGPALAALGAAAAAAIPLVIALSGAALALAGSIAIASTSALAIVPVLGSIGLAAGVVGIAFAGLGDSVKAVDKAKAAVQTAKTGMAEATKGSKAYEKATKDLATAQGKLDAALAGLGPNTKKFIDGMDGAKDALKGIQGFVRERLFAGIGDQLAPLVSKWAPQLKSSFGGIAITLNGAARQLVGFLKKGSTIKGFQNLVKGLGPILDDVLAAIGPIAKGFGNLFMGLLGPGKRLSGTILGIAQSFQKWTEGATKGGGLGKFLDGAMDTFGDLWDIIKNVASALGTLFSAGDDTGKGFIGGIKDASKAFADFLKSPKGQKALTQFFADAKTAVSDVVDFIKTNWPEIQGLVNNLMGFGRLLSAVWRGISPILKPVMKALGVANTFIGDVYTKVAEFVTFLNGVSISDVFGPVGDFFKAIPGVIVAAGDAMGVAFNNMYDTVTTFLTNVASAIGTWVANTATAFAGWVAGWATGFASWVASTATAFASWVAGWATGFALWVAGAAVAVAQFVAAFAVGIASWVAGAAVAVAQFVAGFAVAIAGWVAGAAVWVAQFVAQFATGLAGWVTSGAAAVVSFVAGMAAQLGSWVTAGATAVSNFISAFAGLAGRIIAAAGSLISSFTSWMASIPGAVARTVSAIISAFSGLAGRIIASAGSLASSFAGWVAGIPAAAVALVSSIISAFSGLAGRILAAAGSLASSFAGWASAAVSAVASVPGRIVALFSGLAGRIISAIGTIIPHIKLPHIPGLAAGAVVNGATLAVVGEKGPEAVVPLRKGAPLDPSIHRLLASVAAARGIGPSGGGSSGTSSQVPVVPSITVLLPTGDPEAAAMAVMNRLASSLAS